MFFQYGRKIAAALWNRLEWWRKLFNLLKIIQNLWQLKWGEFYRDDAMGAWLTLFSKQLEDKKAMESLLKNLDTTTKAYFEWLIQKIRLLSDSSTVEYDKVFNTFERDNTKQYGQFLLKNLNNPFSTSFYYTEQTSKKFNISIQDGDILDCGAYDGDTSFAFSHQFPNTTIYAFEPERRNYELLLEDIRKYQKEWKIIPVQFGVSDKAGEIYIEWSGAGAHISQSWKGEKIKLITIDEYVKTNNLAPRLIKWDVEGAEYGSMLGATETIRKYKPILLISIYHNGKDFFEIKPLIESPELDYKFGIDRWHWSHPFADTLLVCY